MASADLAPTSPATAPAGVAALPGTAHVRRPWQSPFLILGTLLVFGPLVASLVARAFVSRHGLQVFAYNPSLHPSHRNLLGTDSAGRDLLASIVYGIPPTYELGLLAGAAATAFGAVLGLVAGYYGKAGDLVIRGVGDALLGIPSLAILIVVAAMYGAPSIETLSLIIASLSWPLAARAIRSQVLTLREQPFIVMARLSNRSSAGIIFSEIFPNLATFVMSTFVGAVSGTLLLAVTLQLLGLGPAGVVTLGLTLQTAISGGALTQGLWWWWASPTALLVLLFIGLFSMSLAVDQIANPRLRREAARG